MAWRDATVSDLSKGYWYGLLGVVIFAATVPFTRLAVGSALSPQLDAGFVTHARAAIAAVLSLLWLWGTRAHRPSFRDAILLLATGLCLSVGFPLLMALAMRTTSGSHASVMLGALPLMTAGVSAILHRARLPLAFWLWALFGSACVMVFSIHDNPLTASTISSGDVLLMLGVVCAAFGYSIGARLSASHRPDHVICWALLFCSPVNLPLAWASWPATSVALSAWVALGYLSVFSMWLGFFAWYRGLALGGAVKVSQVQLVQPFLGILISVPLLKEPLSADVLVFALFVVLSVAGSRSAARTR